MTELPSITCPECSRTSHHPGDIKNLYCSNCHWFTSDPLLKDKRTQEVIGPWDDLKPAKSPAKATLFDKEN